MVSHEENPFLSFVLSISAPKSTVGPVIPFLPPGGRRGGRHRRDRGEPRAQAHQAQGRGQEAQGEGGGQEGADLGTKTLHGGYLTMVQIY